MPTFRCSNIRCITRTSGEVPLFTLDGVIIDEDGEATENFASLEPDLLTCNFCQHYAEDVPRVTELFVNSLGELTRDTALLKTSINLLEVAKNYNLTWTGKTDSSEWQQAISETFQRRLNLVLNKREKEFVDGVYEHQETIEDWLSQDPKCAWTAYGRSRYDHYAEGEKEDNKVWLSTEILAFMDTPEAEAFWAAVYAFVEGAGGEHDVMDEREHLDRSKKVGDEDWTEGPNHGRMERHLNLTWDIYGKSKDEVLALLTQLDAAVGALWVFDTEEAVN